MAGLVALMAGQSAAHASDIGLSFELQSPNSTAKLSKATDKPLQVPSPLEKRGANLNTPNPISPDLQSNPTATSSKPVKSSKMPQRVAQLPEQWWSKGSDSPIAIAIGAAEGTRMTDGSKTPAYYWHTDPGNGADNFGTFSYQHLQPQQKQNVTKESSSNAKRSVAAEAGLPELADELQLQKLKLFHDQLRQQAQSKGISLSELELMNGLDLANQSEAAALSQEGYIDRLAQMRDLVPHDPEEQILEARSWSYWHPERQDWDAPGLGNTYENIRQDQARRMQAIEKALQLQHPTSKPQKQSLPSQTQPRQLVNQPSVDFGLAEKELFRKHSQPIAQTPTQTEHVNGEQSNQVTQSAEPATKQQESAEHHRLRPDRNNLDVLKQLQRSPEVEESSYRVRAPQPGNVLQQAQYSPQPPAQNRQQTVDAIIFYNLETHML
jgi:hypothetical protein